MTESLKFLKIPFDKKFYNLPISHYEILVEQHGYNKVSRHIKELLVYHKDNAKLSEKVRFLLINLSDKFLFESKQDESCECGFMSLGEEYANCPVCNKKLYTGQCFYLNNDHSCSQDGDDCTFLNQKECGK